MCVSYLDAGILEDGLGSIGFLVAIIHFISSYEIYIYITDTYRYIRYIYTQSHTYYTHRRTDFPINRFISFLFYSFKKTILFNYFRRILIIYFNEIDIIW